MTSWHLLRPEWLWAWLPLLWLVWRMSKPTLGDSSWSRVCDAHLLPHILHHSSCGEARWAPGWMAAMGGLLVLAMAGPVWQRHPQPVFHTQSALVLLLDLSRSMDAGDLKPSRLVRAKHKMVDLLRQRREGQTALLVFAGESFVVAPLTQDTATIMAQLSSLDTGLMPLQGSRPERAIKKALDLLHQGGIAHGHILLMTDGWPGPEQMASRVVKEGHTLAILGVGTPEGAPIPLVDGGFLNDANGAIVMAKLDEKRLQKMATLGGGGYQTIRTDDGDIGALLAVQKGPTLASGVEKTDMMSDNWQEEGPWLVLVVLPLAALVFRRGVLLLLWWLLWTPGAVQAVDWDAFWQRPDQQAMQQWEAGNDEAAARLFENREWKGAAHYRAGQYDQAVTDWQESHSTESLYNKGTALAKGGHLAEAAQAFTEVLQQQPDHQDARHNLEVVQKAIHPPDQSGEKSDQTDAQKQSGQQKSDQQKSDQQKSDQQKADQQKADQQKADQPKSPAANEDTRKSAEEGAKPDAGQSSKGQAERPAQPVPGKPSAADKSDPKGSDDQSGMPELRESPATQGARDARTLVEQDEQSKESQVAMEQWLRRIPDDPGGLLRRKFRYQYQRDGAQGRAEEGMEAW